MRFRIGFPLLSKELTELAERRQTYVIRVLYACVFYITAGTWFSSILLSGMSNPRAMLGRGQEMFQQLLMMQAAGIILFMPALTSNAITHEKERNSLGLLLITKLGPTKIIFEKLLSRLVPMTTCLLLAMPLFAFAYSLGGVATEELVGGMWFLAVLSIQIGSLSLLCSALSSTSVGAFIGSYVAVAILFCTCFWPAGTASMHSRGSMTLTGLFGPTAMMFVSIVFMLPVAISMLVERAFVQPQNLLMEFFKSMDEGYRGLNRITGGIVLTHENTALPGDEPIAWRETTRKSLGTVRYLFRVLTAFEFPLLFMLVLVAGDRSARFGSTASVLLYLTWIIGVVLIAIQATGLISGERTRETLDVLLTTPLTGKRILLEKFRSARRLVTVLAVPLFTVQGFEIWWWLEAGTWREVRGASYTVVAILSTLVYLSLAVWFAFWMGLRFRSQTRAILFTLVLMLAWIFVPLSMASIAVYDTRWGMPGPVIVSAWHIFNPAALIMHNEQHQALPTWWVALNLGASGAAAFSFRWNCLTHADRYLGRCVSRVSEADAPDSTPAGL